MSATPEQTAVTLENMAQNEAECGFMCDANDLRAAASLIRSLNERVERLEEALKWFADTENWGEEQLSEGVYFSAEWRPGFSPLVMAARALERK